MKPDAISERRRRFSGERGIWDFLEKNSVGLATFPAENSGEESARSTRQFHALEAARNLRACLRLVPLRKVERIFQREGARIALTLRPCILDAVRLAVTQQARAQRLAHC